MSSSHGLQYLMNCTVLPQATVLQEQTSPVWVPHCGGLGASPRSGGRRGTSAPKPEAPHPTPPSQVSAGLLLFYSCPLDTVPQQDLLFSLFLTTWSHRCCHHCWWFQLWLVSGQSCSYLELSLLDIAETSGTFSTGAIQLVMYAEPIQQFSN